MTSEKHWRDKGGTDVADGVVDIDEVRHQSLLICCNSIDSTISLHLLPLSCIFF